ncbi:MAG TPA: HEAT repeat domain-containing protein, partial [Kofleriaceae bacterium]|nr:HEAT repeat domain-containing protein [Kofleriaceae bacterium]
AGPPPTPAAAREQATSVLRALMSSPSPRVAREAATALARTCDKGALDTLNHALSDDPSAIAKVDVARTMAACGDERGKSALRSALAGGRRDVHAEAARMLAELGDPAGLAALVELGVPKMFRVSAGELLALNKHPRGMAQLEAAFKDSKATADERLRAAIAMTAAGDKTHLAETEAALERLDFRPEAAQALARIGDASAKPHLIAGLALPSLRVPSAQGLRRIDHDLDPTPYLAPLVTALTQDPEVARASAAEAILVLTGPLADAERP